MDATVIISDFALGRCGTGRNKKLVVTLHSIFLLSQLRDEHEGFSGYFGLGTCEEKPTGYLDGHSPEAGEFPQIFVSNQCKISRK